MLKLLGVTLSLRAIIFILVFTVVEIIGLVLWLIFAATPAALAVSPGRAIFAIIVLAVFLLVEHTLSTIAGKV
jgi:hypothetical protein